MMGEQGVNLKELTETQIDQPLSQGMPHDTCAQMQACMQEHVRTNPIKSNQPNHLTLPQMFHLKNHFLK